MVQKNKQKISSEIRIGLVFASIIFFLISSAVIIKIGYSSNNDIRSRAASLSTYATTTPGLLCKGKCNISNPTRGNCTDGSTLLCAGYRCAEKDCINNVCSLYCSNVPWTGPTPTVAPLCRGKCNTTDPTRGNCSNGSTLLCLGYRCAEKDCINGVCALYCSNIPK